ncbi:MAG: hypothetical protein F7C09_01095 [Aeropyrum sp.]|nr:hypothetical protein [Aeropyrum sp.]
MRIQLVISVVIAAAAAGLELAYGSAAAALAIASVGALALTLSASGFREAGALLLALGSMVLRLLGSLWSPLLALGAVALLVELSPREVTRSSAGRAMLIGLLIGVYTLAIIKNYTSDIARAVFIWAAASAIVFSLVSSTMRGNYSPHSTIVRIARWFAGHVREMGWSAASLALAALPATLLILSGHTLQTLLLIPAFILGRRYAGLEGGALASLLISTLLTAVYDVEAGLSRLDELIFKGG